MAVWSQNKPALRVVVPTLEGGGSERVCVRLCNSWAEDGVPIDLIMVRSVGPYLATLDPRVTRIDLNAPRIIRSVGALRRAINRWPGVPVLVFGFDLGVVIGLLRCLRLIQAPVIFREGSSPLLNVPRCRRPLYRLAVGGADAFVAQSRYTAGVLKDLGMGRHPFAVLPNPVGGAIARAQPAANQTRDGFPRLLAVGRLSPEKRFDVLLRAFAALLNRQAGATLELVGEGSERARLSRLAAELGVEDRVTMPGFMSDVQCCYGNAHLFVLSSRFEGQPNALLEAILSGCPVLATGGEAVRELLSDVGLADSYIDPGEFEHGFAVKVMDLLAKPPAYWTAAATRLAVTVAPITVARRYLEFCRQFS